MDNKKLKYEMDISVVNTLLRVLDRTQISGVRNAQELLRIVELLNSPVNKEELEKEQLESLKNKFEPKGDEKKK